MMENCVLCPRNCNVNRNEKIGYCGMTNEITVARAALHFWEEPCISGGNGSGTVFFSGCNMKCIYCQNRPIAIGKAGKTITPERLCEIFCELAQKGAHNINLVTPTHFADKIAKTIETVKKRGFSLPFVYNCGGYESVSTLKMLDGLIDIYIPDFKYWSVDSSQKYSNAPDYTEVAKAAIEEMYRQCGSLQYDGDGMLKKGVIVRHMLIPAHVYDAKCIIKYLYESYGENIIYSIMSQYTPMAEFEGFPELCRRVTKKEYGKLVDYVIELGIENAYIQDGASAKESFIPAFDNEGV